MKLYAPKYYENFVCIADKCRHSCCIGWEIDVDEDSLEKYGKLCDGYGENVKKSISLRGTPHFKLKKDDRCPHLDKNGLCRIILNLGEGYLCNICREHPRFYNETARGKEVGIGISCEEACRIVLSSDSYADFVEIGEINEPFDGGEWDFDAVAERKKIYGFLLDSSLLHYEKLSLIEEKYSVSPKCVSDEVWRERLASLEYLDEAHRSAFACYSSDLSADNSLEVMLERVLAYFVFRHCSRAEGLTEFRAALGFSLFCERLFASLCAQNGVTELSEVVELARIISEELEYSEENTEELMSEFYFC